METKTKTKVELTTQQQEDASRLVQLVLDGGGETVLETAQKLRLAQYADTLEADARAFRRADELLEDPRGVESVFWEALREESPLAAEKLSGKDMEAVEQALASAIRWVLNLDGASADVELEERDGSPEDVNR
jgi:hypothetical protein